MTVRPRAHVVLLLAFLASLSINLLLYGGLARLPEGQVFVESARRESPVALVYMTAGRWLLLVPGLAGLGEGMARSAFGAAFPAAQATPGAASDLIETGDFGRAHALARLAYWLAPLLFAAWLVAFGLRARGVHLVRNRR
jgi:hypothetical protein